MATKKIPKHKPEHMALLMAHIERQGNVVAVSDAVRLYGQDLVDAALMTKRVMPTTIKLKHPQDKMPTQTIPAIMTSQWDRSRPAWLDRYL
jgi:hypothetical protein